MDPSLVILVAVYKYPLYSKIHQNPIKRIDFIDMERGDSTKSAKRRVLKAKVMYIEWAGLWKTNKSNLK